MIGKLIHLFKCPTADQRASAPASHTGTRQPRIDLVDMVLTAFLEAREVAAGAVCSPHQRAPLLLQQTDADLLQPHQPEIERRLAEPQRQDPQPCRKAGRVRTKLQAHSPEKCCQKLHLHPRGRTR